MPRTIKAAEAGRVRLGISQSQDRGPGPDEDKPLLAANHQAEALHVVHAVPNGVGIEASVRP